MDYMKTKPKIIRLFVALGILVYFIIIFVKQNQHSYIYETTSGFLSHSTGDKGQNYTLIQGLATQLDIPPKTFPKQTIHELASQFVFVTYASVGFFLQLRTTIEVIQQVVPGRQIVVFDLGLYWRHALEVKSWSGVIYRKFNFTRYPPHVRTLTNYAFKILSAKEAMEEYSAIFCIDSSIRMISPNISDIIDAAERSGGFLLFSRAGPSTFAVTNPLLYDYFPVDLQLLKDVEQMGAYWFGVYTENTYWNLFHWLILCALDSNCINPKGSRLRCHFQKDTFNTYAGCHRYDQSILNILVLDAYGKHNTSWNYGDKNVFDVKRGHFIEFTNIKYNK